MSRHHHRPALLVAGALVALGCEEKAEPTAAPQSRSQAVVAAGPAAAAPAEPAPAAPVAAPSAASARPRPVLCAGQLGQPPKDAPKSPVARAGEKGALPESIPFGEDHWTWVNLWAAWCVPCREEIPRLRSWAQKTAGERVRLEVAFVSMDDDGRQLEKFLGAQPATGLRSTYWLRDGQERTTWLKEAGLGDPELPAHVLVDPSGKIRCRQQGAIEDGDFPEVLKILRGERGGPGAGHRGENEHGLRPPGK